MTDATVLIVPGLRDQVAEHWQTLLEAKLRAEGRPVAGVPPMGRDDLDCAAKVAAIERTAQSVDGPIVIVAHSGGCVMVAHWVRWARSSGWSRKTLHAVRGALLAAPPEFDRPMPAGYPTLAQLGAGGWLPVPRDPLPFPSIVAASRNDPLARYAGVAELARDWGSRLVDLGDVGHLNPASGFGEWPRADEFIRELAADSVVAS